MPPRRRPADIAAEAAAAAAIRVKMEKENTILRGWLKQLHAEPWPLQPTKSGTYLSQQLRHLCLRVGWSPQQLEEEERKGELDDEMLSWMIHDALSRRPRPPLPLSDLVSHGWEQDSKHPSHQQKRPYPEPLSDLQLTKFALKQQRRKDEEHVFGESDDASKEAAPDAAASSSKNSSSGGAAAAATAQDSPVSSELNADERSPKRARIEAGPEAVQ
jgi:hypothetical protein